MRPPLPMPDTFSVDETKRRPLESSKPSPLTEVKPAPSPCSSSTAAGRRSDRVGWSGRTAARRYVARRRVAQDVEHVGVGARLRRSRGGRRAPRSRWRLEGAGGEQRAGGAGVGRGDRRQEADAFAVGVFAVVALDLAAIVGIGGVDDAAGVDRDLARLGGAEARSKSRRRRGPCRRVRRCRRGGAGSRRGRRCRPRLRRPAGRRRCRRCRRWRSSRSGRSPGRRRPCVQRSAAGQTS